MIDPISKSPLFKVSPWHLGALIFLAGLEMQCAARFSGPEVTSIPVPADRGWTLPTDVLSTQRLFRVRYEDQDGRVGMKLILKLSSETDFQVLTNDALGRPLWSLQTGGSQTLMIDHRGKVYCLTEEIHLPEAVLQVLPWQSLPRVLLGYLPAVPEMVEQSSSGELRFRDADDRRWTARIDDGRPESWVLWGDDRPLLWWSRQGTGGVLSHARGVQFRWREIVREPMEHPPADLQIPVGYRPSDCHASDLP